MVSLMRNNMKLMAQNAMSDEKAMTQQATASGARKRNPHNTGKARRERALRERAEAMASKETKTEENGNKLERLDEGKLSSNTNDARPPNGHGVPPAARLKKNTFIKQSSEASSSAATAEINVVNDSMVSTDASKSFVTSISVGGQTDKSAGQDSVNSTQSAQSTAEIKAQGVELICKFYARQPTDKKKCLLRDCAITFEGEVLITDARNKNIKVFTLDGEHIRTIEHQSLKDPFGVAPMTGSRFVVADCKAKDLKIFSIDGSLVQTVGHNLDDYPMKEPRGVAVNSKGEIIVSDSTRRCVYIYPLEGAFCDIIWGEAGLKPLQFKNPAYVGVTDDDDIIVSDYFSKKISLFDAQTHDLKFTYGTKATDRKLRYPRGVTTDAEGNILVADNYNGKVHYVNGEEGGFIRYVYGDKHGIHRPRSVASDQCGNMVVIENGGRVRIFDITEMSPNLQPAEIEKPPEQTTPNPQPTAEKGDKKLADKEEPSP